jgi:hypothetical protein
MKNFQTIAVLLCASSAVFSAEKLNKAVLQSPSGTIRVEITAKDKAIEELIRIKDHGQWVNALSVTGSATRVTAGAPGSLQSCATESVDQQKSPDRIVIHSDCGAGRAEQTISLSPEPDVINITVRFTPKEGALIHSVEDRYTFAPGRRTADMPLRGPIDFVWSQNIKSESTDLMPEWCFKSPVVMLQQSRVFVALMPNLTTQVQMPFALDLDVTSQTKPWLSYGNVASEPHGHSYFRRKPDGIINSNAGVVEYSYAVVASPQPLKLGYRRIVRRLWGTLGQPQLLRSVDLQRNVRRPELVLFDDWRQDAWTRYAAEVYRDVDCSGGECGTLSSNRNYMGDWDHPSVDAWFNSWFQTLRTAYGWYLYGRRTQSGEIKRRAEAVLNLALHSPQQEGAFSSIYLVPEHRWIREDGWAGFPDDYHAFCMSWTAYWMLKWAEDLTPDRKGEVLAFTRPYGDFLVKHQQSSGVIPSWYDSKLKPREEFRDYNAETAGSALFLLELSELTGNHAYREAGARAMDFITRETLPRQRWFDYETFKSCARKKMDFYDGMTAQYPQNNLSTMQAAMAYLKLYRLTKRKKWLDLGTEVLDYLLLTQQVWNGPEFDPQLLGGFTTQNTDAEWSDARQCYAAILLWDYYQETQDLEYLERAVAASRASFAVAPWENWAHVGYNNEPGSLTGFHWGTGSAMTSVEIMSPMLGDAFINVAQQHGVGFNASSVRHVKVVGTAISFDVDAVPKLRKLNVRFAGAKPLTNYQLSVNSGRAITVSGEVLNLDGYTVELAAGD